MANNSLTFAKEDLPSLLYQKLDEILANTQYQSLQSLVSSSHLEIELKAKGQPALLIYNNEDDLTFDLYHSTKSDPQAPYLIFKADIAFGKIEVLYLKQPHKSLLFEKDKGDDPLDAQFYVLGWLVSMLDINYR